ncbi:hypothetical protein L1887_35706 [Cichorium endivia]|nr:hypothetical protein L1887_35706 [Cichorium endivia]
MASQMTSHTDEDMASVGSKQSRAPAYIYRHYHPRPLPATTTTPLKPFPVRNRFLENNAFPPLFLVPDSLVCLSTTYLHFQT